ncbi:MAG: BMP family ABC transporter substrate-binding protein [Acidimicrobiia bacterium]|nr:BMP family ABC transporter substrate-binding protein [Acidimicrobiia bacterium]MBT8191853.1 BMP family ABC transporter substrate-binding protein [Acidimicrobiia bacterium]NNF89559.1 BMP family ABC transporter substrate-binding protein [Acidimicrobiia bacterium]NNJ46325.1 BMP family ABC transporter substrate-binding protein [Acidimicrobiia bacterium]NNL12839.1 BMP family ABC transporter substrate-binding protein [Acidimicrobiia bacterium]
MFSKRAIQLLAVLLAFALVAAACGDDSDSDATTATTAGTTTTADAGDGGDGGDDTTTTTAAPEPVDFTLGMILVGPKNDNGYSQAHFEGAEYVIEKLGLTDDNLLLFEFANTTDTPGLSLPGVARDMVDLGADLIVFNSDDMKTGAFEAAEELPDVPMIWVSGDSAWADGKDYRPDLANLSNVWAQMTYGKMIAGCAAALTTQTGDLAYLGPLTNDETRRLVNAAYVGAQYCWENYRGESPADLSFTVTYIGFWFEIPGLTLDPVLVVNDFIDDGADVTLSGIDANVALRRTGQRADAGESLWAVPYDFIGACDEAPDVCLGVPYFNWGPAYLEAAQAVLDGSFTAEWHWYEPDWANINDLDSSVIGFYQGDGLSADNAASLDTFIDGLADGSIELFKGPLNWQDGTAWLADGETATDFQVWYSEQCLEGIVGACSINVFG